MMLVDFEPDHLHPAQGWFKAQHHESKIITSWPGWRRHPTGVYKAPAWASAAIAAQSKTLSITWSERARKARDQLVTAHAEALQWLHGSLPVVPGPEAFPTERVPKVHQWRAVKALVEHGCRALLTDEMGLGKTSTALWALDAMQCRRILIICPVFLKRNWQRELALTLGEHWIATIVEGTARHRASILAEAQSIEDKQAIIINYDLLRHLSKEQLAWLGQCDGVIFDESHYVKNRLAERSKLCADIASTVRCVLCCTGTPIMNLADDVFHQVEMVRPGTWTSWKDFANRHLVIQQVTFGSKRPISKVVGTKNLEELSAVLNTMMVGRKKADVLDLPPKTYLRPELELEGIHHTIYKAMKDFARIEVNALVRNGLQSATIFDPRAKSAVEAIMRCEQIAQGYIDGVPDPVMDAIGETLEYGERIRGRSRAIIFPSSPKLAYVLETIQAIKAQGGKVVVFTRFNAPGDWLEDELMMKHGIETKFMHGSVPDAERASMVDDFQEGELRCLIVQVKVASGFNLTRCQDAIFLGTDWSPAINMQAEDRLHRMGQKGTVMIHQPVVVNTIERLIERRLAAKKADMKQALQNLTLEQIMEEL